MNVIGTAAREYFSRPNDEKFSTPGALISAAANDKAASVTRAYNLKDLKACAVDAHGLQLVSPRGPAVMSHWSFGQLSRMVGAPASYLNKLASEGNAELVASAINHGIAHSPIGATASVLAQMSDTCIRVRSITSDSYGRLWDCELGEALTNALPTFQAPPIWDGGTGGWYRGDRDSFMMLIDGGSIVNDATARTDGRMYRGIMVRNSEVGAAGVLIECVLYQFICGNLNLWGAVLDKRFRRVHRGQHVLRDVVREIYRAARQWSDRPASADEALIGQLAKLELAHTREAVIDELRKIGATIEQAETAYDTCATSGLFGASPRSFWGLAQGMTRASQSSAYQGDRLEFDALAAKLLLAGRQRVAV